MCHAGGTLPLVLFLPLIGTFPFSVGEIRSSFHYVWVRGERAVLLPSKRDRNMMRNVLLAVGLCVAGVCADAADTVRVWTLQQCLDYAEEQIVELWKS